MKKGVVTKAGAGALAISLLAANTATAMCARPQELTALRAAALRQQLMVAALTCHEANAFNRFVTTYQGEFQNSDRALMDFFVRKDGHGADDAYNAYKTRQANDASLRSLGDPRFCGEAASVFDTALSQNPTLAALVTQIGPFVRTAYQGCTRGGSDVADAATGLPALPVRHRDILDAPVPTATPAAATQAGAPPTPPRPAAPPALPDESTAPAQTADVREADNAATGDEERYAENAPGDGSYQGAYDQGYQPPPTYRQAYNAPYPYSSYAPQYYGYGRPMPLQQVQGADGNWYLVPAYGR